LARVASLARSVEPELLRALRLGLGARISGTRLSVSAESALWFSNFVESRGADAITLRPEVLYVLRPELANDPQLLQGARTIVEDCHKSAPDVLQWEERIVYLALTGQTALLEQEIWRGLRSVSQGTRQPLVNWISDMWLRLPPEATSNPVLGKLYQYNTGLLRRKSQSASGGESSVTDLLLDFSSFPTRELGVVLRNDRFVIGDLANAKFGIEVPDLEAVELDIAFGPNKSWVEQRTVGRGQAAEIDIRDFDTIRVRTIAGRIHELAVSFFRPPKARLRVFISYSHDSGAHSERVLALTERLRADGIETLLDQYVNGPPPSGWPRWHQKQIARADFIIVVCTEGYYRRLLMNVDFDERAGADWASLLSRQEIYSSRRDKFVPVCLTRDEEQYIPEPIRSSTYFILDSEDGYEGLYRRLTEQPPLVKPFAPDKDSIRSAGTYDISRLLGSAPAELVGRENEMGLLDDALEKMALGDQNRPRILILVGAGGEGKTSIVAKWATAVANRKWDGCDTAFAWSFYDQGSSETVAASSDAFLAEALRFFGDPDTAAGAMSSHDKGKRLAQLVGEKRTLLILDGIESLLETVRSLDNARLRDVGLSSLLESLADMNQGLCVLTSRYSIPELSERWQPSVNEILLRRLSKEAGTRLLKTLGVHGSNEEFDALVADVNGHPLTLNLIGSYLRDAHGGDIRKRDLVKLADADAKELAGRSLHMYATYLRSLAEEDEDGRRAVALLRLMGLFGDRAPIAWLTVLCQTPAIKGLTEEIISLSVGERTILLNRLRNTKLLTIHRPPDSSEITEVSVEPLMRQYLAHDLKSARPAAWSEANLRLFKNLSPLREGFDPQIEDIAALVQVVAFGCEAGLYEEAFDRIYMARIQRENQRYVTTVLGAFGLDLNALACFFDKPWHGVRRELPEPAKALVLNNAAFDLRALGRLTEALEPSNASLEFNVKSENWKAAAMSAANLTELHVVRGDLGAASEVAARSIDFAARSFDTSAEINGSALQAHVMNQLGRFSEAEKQFAACEQMQAQRHPQFSVLYGIPGYLYCDLLLIVPEREAWKSVLGLENRASELDAGWGIRTVSDRLDKIAGLQSTFGASTLLETGLHQLIEARTKLYNTIHETGGLSESRSISLVTLADAMSEAEAALNTIRRAGLKQHIPPSLLMRGYIRAVSSANAKSAAKIDFDEAWEIAERGPMSVHMADIHLYRARLFHAEKPYPWNKNPNGTARGPIDDLRAARQLIEQCGYWRRKEELEDAEEAAKSWV
jgi:tetratricopeptide (TPR) repeat protein